MSVDKYKITRLINRKPIEISKMQTIEKDGGIVMNYHKTVITQIVEAQEKVEFECICAEIQKFIEENNIDICYVINKSELIDCLQEHQILKLEIADLEAKLETKEKNIRILTKKLEEEADEWIAVRDDKNKVINKQTEKIKELKQKLAEKEELYSDALETVDLLFTNQPKIDYAVEQLEKAKELVEKRNNGTRQGSHSVEYKDGYSGCSCDVDTIIDQLITEIKEGK